MRMAGESLVKGLCNTKPLEACPISPWNGAKMPADQSVTYLQRHQSPLRLALRQRISEKGGSRPPLQHLLCVTDPIAQ